MTAEGMEADAPYQPRGSLRGKRFGHTFSKHGSHNTDQLLIQANNSGVAVGQFLDDAAAEEFIASHLPGLKQGPKSVDAPPCLGRVINPDGTFTPANKIRIIPSGSGVKTAYPMYE